MRNLRSFAALRMTGGVVRIHELAHAVEESVSNVDLTLIDSQPRRSLHVEPRNRRSQMMDVVKVRPVRRKQPKPDAAHLARSGAGTVVVSHHVVPEKEDRINGVPRDQPVPEQKFNVTGSQKQRGDDQPERAGGPSPSSERVDDLRQL